MLIAVLEKARALAQHDGVEEELKLVDEVVGKEEVRRFRAAKEDDIVSRLTFQPLDLRFHITRNQPRVAPTGFRQSTSFSSAFIFWVITGCLVVAFGQKSANNS